MDKDQEENKNREKFFEDEEEDITSGLPSLEELLSIKSQLDELTKNNPRISDQSLKLEEEKQIDKKDEELKIAKKQRPLRKFGRKCRPTKTQNSEEKPFASKDIAKNENKPTESESVQAQGDILTSTKDEVIDIKDESGSDNNETINKNTAKPEPIKWISTFFLWLFQHNKGRKMNESDFLLATMLSQFSLQGMICVLDSCVKSGAIATLLIYIVSLIVISAPLYLLCFFMGSYSRKGYITFWDSMPFFRGVGFMIFFHEFGEQLLHEIDHGVTSIQYLFVTLTHADVAWEDCDSVKGNETCISFNFLEKTDTINCSEPLQVASEVYQKNVIMEHFGLEEFRSANSIGTFHIGRLLALVVLTVILIITANKGIHAFQKAFKKMLLLSIFYLCFLVVWATFYSLNECKETTIVEKSWKDLLNVRTVLDCMTITTEHCGPGSMVYIASLAPDGASPTKFTVYMVFLKIIVIIIIIIFQVAVSNIVIETYGLASNLCVDLTGTEILFSAVPDTLSHLPTHRVFFVIYFLCLNFIIFSSCFYIFVSSVESWIQVIPKLEKYRLQFCVFLGIFLYVSSVPFHCQAGMVYGQIWFTYACLLKRAVIMYLFSYLISHNYTIEKLEHDYQFTFRADLQRYWILAWRLSPMLMTVVLVFYFRLELDVRPDCYLYELMKSCIACLITIYCLPLPIVIIRNLYRKWTKKSYSDLHSALTWGPEDKHLRKLRRSFNPEKQIGYKMSQSICNHKCLIYNKMLKEECKSRRTFALDLKKDLMRDDEYYFKSLYGYIKF